MELVTGRENTMRGYNPCAINGRKTHCAQGHPYDLFNTRINRKGQRLCIICVRIHNRDYMRRQRAKQQAVA